MEKPEVVPGKTYCWHCGHEMIWGGDHSFEDYGIEDEDGIVANLSCSNPDCNTVAYFHTSFGAIQTEGEEVLEATGTDG